MKILALPLIACALTLTACGSSNPSPGEIEFNNRTSSEDTPATRLQAAQNHPQFSGLVQAMSCDSKLQIVSGVVYESRLNLKNSFLDPNEVCATDVKLFIDSGSGLLRWWQDCTRAGMHLTHTLATSHYSISGNTLTITDTSSVTATAGQSNFTLTMPNALNDASITRTVRKELRNSSGESLYSTFCPKTF